MTAWKRLEFVDFLRGVAVILMLIYHVFFDLSYFNKISLNSLFWYFFPRFIGGMFIFISGISLTLARRKYGKRLLVASVKRGIKFFCLGLLITIITLPTRCYVRFGILHFFGIAVILGSFFSAFRVLSLLAGFALILTGITIQNVGVANKYAFWLGFKPKICMLDYYPLLPWFGFMLIGIAIGNSLNLDLKIPKILRPITLLGRKSLLIYLIQHPLILLLMQAYYGDVFEQIASMVLTFWSD